jgi:hypothetical protein
VESNLWELLTRQMTTPFAADQPFRFEGTWAVMDDFRKLVQDPEHKRQFERLLFLAAKRGGADLVAERLGWGVDPNCSFNKARTPLMANVRGAFPSAATVLALLRHGADPHLVDETGLMALDYARRKLIWLHGRQRPPAQKSRSLDENGQLALSTVEQSEIDRLRNEFGPDGSEFVKIYWSERLRAARRVFQDPREVEAIVDILETSGSDANKE